MTDYRLIRNRWGFCEYSRRRFFLALAIVATILGTLFAIQQETASARSPNVILIVTDDQGYGDSGVHGNQQLDTPHIDSIGREGVEFRRFYVEPVCAPTRASLMTGRYYYRTGVIHTSRGGAKMAGSEVTLAELFSQNGYRTGIFGKWHLGDNYPMRPQDQGFQEALWHKSGGIGQAPDKPNSYFNPLLWRNGEQTQEEGYCTDIFFSAAIDFIQRNRDKPFFIYLPTNTPHTPLEISDDYVDPYERISLDNQTARVYGMIKNIDDNVGRLLAHLEELQIEDQTIVVFISDNGPNTDRYNAGLRGRKSSIYEGGIRAISFWYWPGRWDGGRKINQIAAHIDVLPTLIDVCGIESPSGLRLDGITQAPLLDGETDAKDHSDRTLFIQCHRGLIPEPYQNSAVISQQYKLVGYPGTFAQESLVAPREDPLLELYDLESDPGESSNLAHHHPDILSELREAYDFWFSDVKGSRGFEAGTIKLGEKGENPAVLCRYQDANYHLGLPHGWTVEIETGGQYEVIIDRGHFTGPGDLVVKWNGEEQRRRLERNGHRGTFVLSAGEGNLEVWFELDLVGRLTFSENHTIGDVEFRFLESAASYELERKFD